jgi:hypothetical protein
MGLDTSTDRPTGRPAVGRKVILPFRQLSCVVLSCEPVKGVSLEFGDSGSAEGPGPWLGGHRQSSTVLSRQLVSAVRKLQGRQEQPLLEDCNQATTSRGCSRPGRFSAYCSDLLSVLN